MTRSDVGDQGSVIRRLPHRSIPEPEPRPAHNRATRIKPAARPKDHCFTHVRTQGRSSSRIPRGPPHPCPTRLNGWNQGPMIGHIHSSRCRKTGRPQSHAEAPRPNRLAQCDPARTGEFLFVCGQDPRSLSTSSTLSRSLRSLRVRQRRCPLDALWQPAGGARRDRDRRPHACKARALPHQGSVIRYQ